MPKKFFRMYDWQCGRILISLSRGQTSRHGLEKLLIIEFLLFERIVHGKQGELELSREFYDSINNEVEKVMEQGPYQEILSQCLQKLSTEHLQIIRLRYTDGKSVEEVSRSIKRTVTATYRVISRIRESLRKCVYAHASIH